MRFVEFETDSPGAEAVWINPAAVLYLQRASEHTTIVQMMGDKRMRLRGNIDNVMMELGGDRRGTG